MMNFKTIPILALMGIFFLFIVYEVVALVFALGAYIFLAIHKDLPGAGLMATASNGYRIPLETCPTTFMTR
ncbi:hypothetical protein [uncultured Muriicola sp.]|uniref:hypothetical protein n=1 Tax=uncultured Muriicola sp. TaxID=1583102 RepID=UPI002611F38B|nr:hypothetical protein [uncultured Muriicola sp.]